jgi:hypothetical protein
MVLEMNRLLGVSAAALVLVGFTGCDPMEKKPMVKEPAKAGSEGHDHHVHEHAKIETFAAAVKDMELHQAIIKTAFTNKKPEDAHEALHDIGFSIESLPKLASKLDLPKEDVASIEKAKAELFESYNLLDETLHGGPGKSYDDVSGKIDSAMTVLKSFVK